MRIPILAASLACLSACAVPVPLPLNTVSTAAREERAPVTILISIDGFRPDYLDRGATPELSALAAAGASGAMRPSAPSVTFPNHWTLVTGLRPDRHGIVANSFEDARRPGQTFTMASDDPFWWNDAEPIWVTAERAGVRTATVSWPGSNVAWGGTATTGAHRRITGGVRPRDWHQYNEAVSDGQRVDAAIDWLRRPAATRPRFVTLYFDRVDTAGHEHGPDAPETTAAVAQVDAAIGRLRRELAAMGQPANLVIVADHGMAETRVERTIRLDRILGAGDYRLVFGGAVVGIEPVAGRETKVAAALLRPHDGMTCYRKAALPAALGYGRNARVPSFVCTVEVGRVAYDKPPRADQPRIGGAHGYDPAHPTMRALFLASGPAFRPGVKLAPFDNTAVAPLLRELLGLPAGTGLDGTAVPFEGARR